MSADPKLLQRPVKSLAWLGDALFELKVRRLLLNQGDFHPRDLDRMGTALVRAEAQAQLLQHILDDLDEDERAMANRAKNAPLRSGGRVARNTRDYRQATGLEALIAYWELRGLQNRIQKLVDPWLQVQVDEQVRRLRDASGNPKK